MHRNPSNRKNRFDFLLGGDTRGKSGLNVVECTSFDGFCSREVEILAKRAAVFKLQKKFKDSLIK